MREKFLNKYRIPSTRCKDWDYDSPAAYFVTICTHNREHYFGEVKGEEVHLSAIGKIVETQWLRTPEVRPDMNLTLDEFVVMPNHFHGILIIGQNEFNKMATTGPHKHQIGPGDVDPLPTTLIQQPIPITTNKFGPQSKNLGSVIRGFKSSVTTEIKKMFGGGDNYLYRREAINDDRRDAMHDDRRDAMHGVSTTTLRTSITAPFAWQPRFHDHIIRDAESFDRIRRYIANNPLNWKEDKFYKEK